MSRFVLYHLALKGTTFPLSFIHLLVHRLFLLGFPQCRLPFLYHLELVPLS